MNVQKLQNVKDKFQELNTKISDPEMIANNKEWTKLCKEQAELQPIVEVFDAYMLTRRHCDQAEELLLHEKDKDLLEMAQAEAEECKEKLAELEDRLKLLLLPADPNDDKNVIVEIRAGAGGDEAGLFGYELMRMYKMYAEKNRWSVEDLDVGLTEIGGVKEAVFSLKGEKVYRKLKFESGVHRVQRVPDTESQGRVHTSTVTVAVLPEVEDVVVDINEKDLKVDTYRSGGAGGQHVNKTDSAVRITHLPTGIVVQCQDERSQIKNRDKAMRQLRSKLYDIMLTEQEREYSQTRKSQVGTGDRSERIRTYNFPQGRVTDHRINMTIYALDSFMNGDLDEMLDALILADQTAKLEAQVE